MAITKNLIWVAVSACLLIGCEGVDSGLGSQKGKPSIADNHGEDDSMSLELGDDAGDGGRSDAGPARPDAGTPRTDAGVRPDAGTVVVDAGSAVVDAGPAQQTPCERFEPNNTIATAALVDAGRYTRLALCGNDVDIFAVRVPANTVLTAAIDFTNDAGDLDLYLSDGTLTADGGTKLIGRSEGSADGEEIPNYPSASARTLYVIAKGWLRPDAGTPDNGPYTLDLKIAPVDPNRDCLANCRDMVQLVASGTKSSTQAMADGYYRVSPPKYVWGRRDMLGLIKYGVKATQARFPASASDAVGISDICQQDGKTPGTDVNSPRHPTTTHVRGKDADIAYFQDDNDGSQYEIICGDGSDTNSNGVPGQYNDGYFCTTPNNVVDLPRQIWFMAKLAESPFYRVVGIDQTLAVPFTNEAKRLLDAREITPGQYRRLTDGLGYGNEGGWAFHHHHIHLSLSE